jgi:pyrroloquinoline quinone (PQQ) biosynthesis protein C
MAQLPGWMPILLDRIQWGCSTSPWFVNLADEAKIDETGKSICRELWPFIRELPTNIAFVRDAIPETAENLQAAKNLLGQLSDDERKYQQLFLNQCYFAGVTEEELCAMTPTAEAEELCEAMRRMCREGGYVDGVHAIVAAEFAATLYSRAALPIYENHFQKDQQHTKEQVDQGLEWLRLHAKTHTRHAIWMKRMLGDIEDDSSENEIPRAAELLLNCVLKLWQCPPEETKQPAAALIS